MAILRYVLLALAALPVSVSAEGLRDLARDEFGTFAAVGRLELDGGRFCTATLIEPGLVLTAAHCIVDDATGRPARADRIVFYAGWRDGGSDAFRVARRTAVPEAYRPEEAVLDGAAFDLALVELVRPIDGIRIAGLAPGTDPLEGEAVGVVSYAHDRADLASIERGCRILARRERLSALDCDVDFGSSGAPVLRFGPGAPTVISVVSAKARLGDRKIAVATAIADLLPGLRARLAAYDGRRVADLPIRRVSRDDALSLGGAKFVRP